MERRGAAVAGEEAARDEHDRGPDDREPQHQEPRRLGEPERSGQIVPQPAFDDVHGAEEEGGQECGRDADQRGNPDQAQIRPAACPLLSIRRAHRRPKSGRSGHAINAGERGAGASAIIGPWEAGCVVVTGRRARQRKRPSARSRRGRRTSRGRARPEEPDEFRTAFERDRDRILHSKAFRRLKHKTQVFINPEGDHYVTRLTHTLQVTQISRSLAAGAGLNEPLAEAIALGHDVGHSPFGHTGEEALSPVLPDRWLASRRPERAHLRGRWRTST